MVYDDQKVYYKKVNITDSETFKKLNLDADKDKVKYANSGINYWLILCDDHAILYRRDADDNPVDCQWTDMMILVSLFKNKNTGK